jgi:uncharacterized protein (DUF4415 family)
MQLPVDTDWFNPQSKDYQTNINQPLKNFMINSKCYR